MNQLKLLKQMWGHEVYQENDIWYYSDNHESVDVENPRPCISCNRTAQHVEGIGMVDPCFLVQQVDVADDGTTMIGRVLSTVPEDATWVCCGHGVEDGYIRWGNLPSHSADALITDDIRNDGFEEGEPWGDRPPVFPENLKIPFSPEIFDQSPPKSKEEIEENLQKGPWSS